MRTSMFRVHRLTMRVAVVFQHLREQLAAQLLVDDLAFSRGVVSM